MIQTQLSPSPDVPPGLALVVTPEDAPPGLALVVVPVGDVVPWAIAHPLHAMRMNVRTAVLTFSTIVGLLRPHPAARQANGRRLEKFTHRAEAAVRISGVRRLQQA